MFATKIGARVQKQAFAKIASRNASSFPTALQQNVWRKSNVLYIAYIATGCLVLGSIYGSAVSFIWEANNRGVSSIVVGSLPFFSIVQNQSMSFSYPLCILSSHLRNYITISTGPSSSARKTRMRSKLA